MTSLSALQPPYLSKSMEPNRSSRRFSACHQRSPPSCICIATSVFCASEPSNSSRCRFMWRFVRVFRHKLPHHTRPHHQPATPHHTDTPTYHTTPYQATSPANHTTPHRHTDIPHHTTPHHNTTQHTTPHHTTPPSHPATQPPSHPATQPPSPSQPRTALLLPQLIRCRKCKNKWEANNLKVS